MVLFVLHGDAPLKETLRRLGCRYEVRPLASWGALFEAARRGPADGLIVIDPYLGSGVRNVLADQLLAFRREFPSSVVLAACEVSPPTVGDLRTLGAWGIAEIINLDYDRNPFRIERLMETAHHRGAAHRILNLLAEHLPTRARGVVESGLAVAVAGGGASDLARALHVSLRSLERRCARAGLPPPRTLLGVLRLLLGARYLDDPGRTVLSAATAAGYASDTSMYRSFRRVGLPAPGRLRDGSVLESAVEACRRVHALGAAA